MNLKYHSYTWCIWWMEIKIYKEYESFINVFGKWIIQIVHVVYMHLLCLFTHTIALSNLIINSSLFSLGSFQGKIGQQLPKKFKWETQVILCLFFISSEKKKFIYLFCLKIFDRIVWIFKSEAFLLLTLHDDSYNR